MRREGDEVVRDGRRNPAGRGSVDLPGFRFEAATYRGEVRRAGAGLLTERLRADADRSRRWECELDAARTGPGRAGRHDAYDGC
ncbi:hypothetical protein OG594_18340 [Streptomyces sp. NBC_01214]|uniref:hypothetical protein n=1 Tax=Streptomyces sp. NBC_01214 TaxID=2903777 RepID=UPI00224DB58A|nr:hypothetical protein [Streptomyces sp. NBC_01214]MCX4803585.1 hypothetical protein [Streptomyces sp. NBC_01214]